MTDGGWHRLVGAAALARGDLRRLTVGERELVIINHGGAYFALDGRCTHRPEALLAEGIVFGDSVMCPWHGYRYDVRTGRNVHPGTAQPIACVALRVDGDDLLVDLGGAAGYSRKASAARP
jgi:nitrite reductase/ring-hydroxylating ferredoxin subunit